METLSEKMEARLDETTTQMGKALRSLVAKYGEDDEAVKRMSKALERRFKALSYVGERVAR